MEIENQKDINNYHKEIKAITKKDILNNTLLSELIENSNKVTPIRQLDINSEIIYKDIYNLLNKHKLSWIESHIILSSYLTSITQGYINTLEKSQIKEDKKNLVLNLLNEANQEILLKLPIITQRIFLTDGLFGMRFYSNENIKSLTKNLGKRFDILKKYNFTCVYCGRKSPEVELQVDHIFPKSLGGLNNDDNLTCSCFECNLGKSNKILDN